MNKSDSDLIKKIELQNALDKENYWIISGCALFDNEEMKDKWRKFVISMVENDFMRGVMLDEILQTITMIKANVPHQVIADALSNCPYGKTIIDSYLAAFIHYDIVGEIEELMNQNSLK